MRIRVAAAFLAVTIAPTAPAEAGEMFLGDPWHGTDMEMRVGDQGRVKRIIVGFSGRCDNVQPDDPADRFEYQGGGKTILRPLRSSARSFTAAKAFRLKVRDGHFAHVRLRVEGVRRSRKRWRGTYRASARVFRDGKRIDTCRTPRTVWKAIRRPRFRFEVKGESGDYVTRGQAWSYASPRYHAWVWSGVSGDESDARFDMNRYPDGLEDWNADFDLPYGQRLEAGRTYKDEHWYPYDEGHPNISLSGLGHGCADETGEFTVHELARDREGHIRRLRVSFVHYCESWGPSRGTVDYTL